MSDAVCKSPTTSLICPTVSSGKPAHRFSASASLSRIPFDGSDFM
jgi:hypothetical protein